MSTLRTVVDRVLPYALAAVVAAVAAAFAARLAAPAGTAAVVTITRNLPAGTRVGPGDLAKRRVNALAMPSFRRPLYTTVPLRAGEALTAGTLTATAPLREVSLGVGVVAENVTLPVVAVAAGVGAGSRVAVSGLVSGSGQDQLLAPQARIVSVAPAPSAVGSAPSRVYTLTLPLGSALAVAAAAHNGTLVLLPWTLPRSEVR